MAAVAAGDDGVLTTGVAPSGVSCRPDELKYPSVSQSAAMTTRQETLPLAHSGGGGRQRAASALV